jgi:hypothetical protein
LCGGAHGTELDITLLHFIVACSPVFCGEGPVVQDAEWLRATAWGWLFAAEYAVAVNAILSSPYKAVALDSLIALMGSQQPRVAVEAMVKANLLALRPYSEWAKDVDAAAFGPLQKSTVVTAPSTVVTAPSAVELYLMEVYKAKLLVALPSDMEVGKGVPCGA